MRILVVNAGSSSLKGALIEPPDRTLARSEVAWGDDSTQVPDQAGRVAALVAALRAHAGDDEPIDAVGHRVVHGGPDLTAAAVVDEAVLDGIRAAQALAPLHNGVALGAIDAARAALPDVPHVACFDTAFHATLPEEAWRYPLPGSGRSAGAFGATASTDRPWRGRSDVPGSSWVDPSVPSPSSSRTWDRAAR